MFMSMTGKFRNISSDFELRAACMRTGAIHRDRECKDHVDIDRNEPREIHREVAQDLHHLHAPSRWYVPSTNASVRLYAPDSNQRSEACQMAVLLSELASDYA